MKNLKEILYKDLIEIALGNSYSEQALYDALHHVQTTQNDKQAIHRFLFGTHTHEDGRTLQALANEIKLWDKL